MLLLKTLYNGIIALNKSCEKDTRLSHYPLLGKPWPMVAVIGLYLLIVLKWGPAFMANRKPYRVEGLMKIYNVLNVVLSFFIFYEGLKYTYMRDDFKLICQKYDLNDTSPATMKLVRPAYLYYISKYIDLCDTMFFILRKKFNQISFLHVYHHTLMILGTFLYCVDAFASHFSVTGILNSFVHGCMYTYYLVAAIKPNVNLELWKRVITSIQLIQFTIFAIAFGVPLFNNWCNLPQHWLLSTFLQNLFLIILFSNFYYNNYIVKDLKRGIQSKND